MSDYPFIQTIRYMGNKGKLLDYIIPEIVNVTKEGDTICDIMAGTNAVSYALKNRNKLITNDIQYYSYIISKCLLNSYVIPNQDECHSLLDKNYEINKNNEYFSFFKQNYTDTYFSENQCIDIDSIRFSIDKINDDNLKSLFLTVLMSAMCKAQSTTGHFAQFLDKNHKRVIPLRKLSIYELFFEKLLDFNSFVKSKYNNLHYNLDYNELFKLPEMTSVKCFYLDSPYTHDQYSRFYHILETVCKYDEPKLEYKAKYRTDRIQSDFCYNSKVEGEFDKIIKFCSERKSNLVISYSNHGVISIEKLIDICKKYYKSIEVKNIDYNHSSQGKGTIKIQEILIILR